MLSATGPLVLRRSANFPWLRCLSEADRASDIIWSSLCWWWWWWWLWCSPRDVHEHRYLQLYVLPMRRLCAYTFNAFAVHDAMNLSFCATRAITRSSGIRNIGGADDYCVFALLAENRGRGHPAMTAMMSSSSVSGGTSTIQPVREKQIS